MLDSYATDFEIREQKIIKYLPLVKLIAGRMAISKAIPVDREDLVGYGIIGLIDAIDKFNPEKGVKFETYATFRIRGAIIDELRKLNWMPRTAMDKIFRLNEATDILKEKLGREPTENELAVQLCIPVEVLKKAESYINYLTIVSLDRIIFESDFEDSSLYLTVEDKNSPSPDNVLQEKEKALMLQKSIEMLDEKDRLILNLYYYEKLTLKEIGCVLNVSESRVCQIHSRTILRLRENMKKLNYYDDK